MRGCSVLAVLVTFVALSESRYHDKSETNLKDLLSRSRRQASRYSRKYNEYMIESAKILLDAVGTDFCKGDPYRGAQCFEEELCVAWEEICDGYQTCALGQLSACLNQTLHDYGYEDKSKCSGEEKQEWCALRLYTPTRCGRDIELKAQGRETITSPNYPARYEDDMECFWSVKVPEGRKITVSIKDFQTEPEVDYVSMGNGLRDTKKKENYIIYRHTGLDLPKPKNFTTSGNELFITFTSDDWDREAGFNIDVADSAVYDPQVPVASSPFPFKVDRNCNEKIELDVGESKKITSPNHPGYYNNSQSCTWSVRITPGRRVGITFTRFDVEDIVDRVEVGSGAEPALPEKVFTGRDLPDPFVSSTSELWVRLVTNPALRRTGFEAIVRDQPYNECGGDIEIPDRGSSSIASPYYPDRSYTLDAFCLWKVKSPPGTELSFYFRDFRTEYMFDSMSLGSGEKPAVNGENYAITLHTGTKLPEPANITIGNNLAWLVFSSDYSQADKGFFVDVYDAAVKKSNTTFRPKEGPKVDNGCGDIIVVKKTNFELSSPGSPNYNPMMDCTWLLSFPIAAELYVRFMRFETEMANDLFEMGTGNDADDPSSIFLSHSGTDRPYDFFSNATDLWIRFRTNFIVEMKGWSIEFDSLPDTSEYSYAFS
ncbi:cubilin-like [Anneissia japonica]|uniref:cubilin-like n=1 Tax=Anneissia japonica TaxID=1529436 RepID=UPI00142578B8|nr:cubilin-like [Anneissia japonica]